MRTLSEHFKHQLRICKSHSLTIANEQYFLKPTTLICCDFTFVYKQIVENFLLRQKIFCSKHVVEERKRYKVFVEEVYFRVTEWFVYTQKVVPTKLR